MQAEFLYIYGHGILKISAKGQHSFRVALIPVLQWTWDIIPFALKCDSVNKVNDHNTRSSLNGNLSIPSASLNTNIWNGFTVILRYSATLNMFY